VVKPVVKNPDTFVFEDYGTVRSLDPACAYDNVSHQRIMNLYESLLAFDGSTTDKFVPVLAEEVPSIENGGITDDGKTYTFKIRKGVTFHAGSELTPENVAYSIKRHMVVDQDGDADRVTVDTQYLPEVETMKDVVVHSVPQLSVSAALFCQQVNPEANPNIGSGELDGEGIPADFFSDVHVRRAFLHAFDRDTYAQDVWNDRVVIPSSFLIGWGADFPDPDNFLFTFMSSEGVYGKYMANENEEVDRLCKEGRFEVDPAKRQVIYERLQNLWYEEAVGCMIYQKIDNFAYRSNIRGFVPHPMLDTAWEDLKEISK